MVAAETLMSMLPASELLDWELKLREALVEALDQPGHNGVFPLYDWIEGRIGGEVGARQDDKDTWEIFFVDGDAEDDLDDGDLGNNSQSMPSGEGGREGRRRDRVKKAKKKNRPSARERQLARSQAHSDVTLDEYFDNLRPDAFTPQEERVRRDILAFWRDWTANQSRPPTLEDLYADRGVASFVKMLPASVRLEDWIDKRLGAEVHLEEDPEKVDSLIFSVAEDSLTADLGTDTALLPVKRELSATASSFFASLPPDDFREEEALMRTKILERLLAAPADESIPLIDVASDPELDMMARAFLDAAGVELQEWIDERIGGEVECKAQADSAQVELCLRKCSFFHGLALDQFTSDEKFLRKALLRFLRGWKASRRCNLSDAGTDRDVSAAKRAVFGTSGSTVSLREWIDRRMGAEILTSLDSNNQISIEANKRRRTM